MATEITLSGWELSERGKVYAPISPVPDVYDYVGHSRWYATRRKGAIPRLIVVHTTESPDATVPGSLHYDARRDEKVSATAFAGEEGLGYSVPEDKRPYTQSRWNDVALSLEVIGTAGWTEEQWANDRAATLINVERAIFDWSERHDIPARWLTPEEVLAGEAGVIDHLVANEAAILEKPSRAGTSGYTHTDIGPGLRAHVLAMLDQPAPAPEPEPTPPPPPDDQEVNAVEKTVITRWEGEPYWIEVGPVRANSTARVWRGINRKEGYALIAAGLAINSLDHELPAELKGGDRAGFPRYRRLG